MPGHQQTPLLKGQGHLDMTSEKIYLSCRKVL